MIELILIEILAFVAVFYKLVTTNHWTIGKKLLVALTAGLVVESLGLVVAGALYLPLIYVAAFKVPKIIVSLLMCYFFYRSEFMV